MNRLLSRGGIVEEDGRRWTKKKVRKKSKTKIVKKMFGKCRGWSGDLSWGTNSPKKIFWALGYDFFEKKNCRNLTVVLRIDSYESN